MRKEIFFHLYFLQCFADSDDKDIINGTLLGWLMFRILFISKNDFTEAKWLALRAAFREARVIEN